MTALLDVDVLLALAWPHHIHHSAAHNWLRANGRHGWATCPLTQAGFVRLCCHPGVVKTPFTLADALCTLERITASADHRFWPVERGIGELLPEIRGRLSGPKQVTDAILLDLAIRRQGVLATFDRAVAALLAPGSPHTESVAVLAPVFPLPPDLRK